MAEETKIVKKETKSDQAKTGASKVQIRQVDIAIIQAQREKAMKEGQKKAEASQIVQGGVGGDLAHVHSHQCLHFRFREVHFLGEFLH